MRMLVRDPSAPGAYDELRLTPVSFRDASLVAKHRQVIAKYLTPRTTQQGSQALNRFEQLVINTRERGPVQLLTDRGTLRELGHAGEFDFGDIYEEAPRAVA